MKKTYASIALAITAILGSMSAAGAMVIDSSGSSTQTTFADTAERSRADEEFNHFRFDNSGGVTGTTNPVAPQLETRDIKGSTLVNVDATARPAGEAPEPGVVVLVALGLAAIIRIRRRQQS